MAVAAAEMAEGGAGGAAAAKGGMGASAGEQVGFSRLAARAKHEGRSPGSNAEARRWATEGVPRSTGVPKRAAEKPQEARKAAAATPSTQPGRLRRAAGTSARAPRAAAQSAGAVQRTLHATLPASSAGGKLITAGFVGIGVLLVLSYITGQYFKFDWALIGAQPKAGPKGGYIPLYQGEQFGAPSPIPQQGGGQPVPIGPRGTGNITLTTPTAIATGGVLV